MGRRLRHLALRRHFAPHGNPLGPLRKRVGQDESPRRNRDRNRVPDPHRKSRTRRCSRKGRSRGRRDYGAATPRHLHADRARIGAEPEPGRAVLAPRPSIHYASCRRRSAPWLSDLAPRAGCASRGVAQGKPKRHTAAVRVVPESAGTASPTCNRGSQMDSEASGFAVLLGGGVGSSHDTEMLEADPLILGDAPRCEVCGLYSGGRPWLPPHRAELTLRGSHWGDFAFRGDGGEDFLISERAAELYRGEKLRGLSGFEQVDIARAKGTDEEPPPYLHVAVGRSQAAVDERGSSLIRPEPPTCQRCRSAGLEAIHGFALEPSSWSGEDVFFARGLTGVVVVSRRFRDFVHSHALTNVRLTPTESYEWDPYAPISGGH